MDNQPVFEQNLGLYQGLPNERVGCHFQQGGAFVPFEVGTKL